MSCHSREELEQMLEDVVNELDLSDVAIATHGPIGTPPSELVRLVLDQKDKKIRMLQAGMVDVQAAKPAEGETLTEEQQVVIRKLELYSNVFAVGDKAAEQAEGGD